MNTTTKYNINNSNTSLISIPISTIKLDKNNKFKLAGFDIDGTIIKTKSGKSFAENKNDWTLLYDNTKSFLTDLINKEYTIVFFSNQGGIGKGKQDREEWINKINNVVDHLNISPGIQIYAATESNKYRKPSIGMCKAFLEQYDLDMSNIDKENSFYCGDAGGRIKDWKKSMKKDFSDSDRKYALNLDIPFFTPEELFLQQNKTNKYILKGLNPTNIQNLTAQNKPINFEEVFVNKQQLFINIGYPGSGKSTFTKKFVKIKVANQDTCKTAAKCLKLCTDSVKEGHNIIIDNTNPDKKTRKKYIDAVKKINKEIHITCLHFTTSMEIAQHNNRYRNITQGVKRIPDVVYYTYRKKLEKPTLDEGFDKIIEVPFILDNVSEEYFMWS